MPVGMEYGWPWVDQWLKGVSLGVEGRGFMSGMTIHIRVCYVKLVLVAR